MNSRISQEKDGLLFTVNTQVQRAIDNAINAQILPQTQTAFRAANGSGPSDNKFANMTSLRNNVSEGQNHENRPRETHYSSIYRFTESQIKDNTNFIFQIFRLIARKPLIR